MIRASRCKVSLHLITYVGLKQNLRKGVRDLDSENKELKDL